MSLPETINITDKQRALVIGLIDGLSTREAGERAGYSGVAVYHALNSASVQHALRTSLMRRMTSEAPAAWRLIVETAHDPTVDRKVRVQCGRDILDRTGFVPPKAAEASAERALEDMTRDELVAFIKHHDDRRAAAAKDVSTSDDAAVDKQLADMLE